MLPGQAPCPEWARQVKVTPLEALWKEHREWEGVCLHPTWFMLT